MNGLCRCGCGQLTPIAYRNIPHLGWVKGMPRPWVPWHDRAKSPVQYVVDEASGCWLWQRATTHDGYGVMSNGGRVYAHRFFYEQRYGPIPEGLQVDHLCGVTGCVNPEHLEPVTQIENVRRGRSTRLTPALALEIWRAEGTYPEIGLRFGIASTTVSGIKNRQRWADVTESEGSE